MILVRAQIAEPASVHDVYARQPIMRIVPVAAVLILATAAAVLASHAPPAARYVPAEIRFEGKVILRGSTSDDGHPDVDAVWDYQRGQLRYAATEDFAALGIANDQMECTLESPAAKKDANGRAGAREAEIEVDVRYGGQLSTFELRLVRDPNAANGAEWRIHEDDLDRLFGNRLIRRDDARRLQDPARKK